MHIFRHIFLRNYWWQKSDIWSQASYQYPISWEVFFGPIRFLLPVCRLVDFYSHWTYMLIFLSNYWWQKSDIWSQASYRYPISWEAFLNPSDSYFLFADLVGFYTHWTYMWGCHKWALAHSSSCYTPAPRRGRGVYCFTSVRPSKIFFVAFFSVTVDDRNLIFDHKHHIGIPYFG